MVTYKCKNCGGQMNFGRSGGFVCPYCGSKAFFSDADFKGNERFRKMLLQYYKAQADKKDNDYDTDHFWTCTGTDSFTMLDGQSLQIGYMNKYAYDGFTCYLAKESVVYVFDSEKDAKAFLAGLGWLVFPAADNRLHRSFPERKMEIGLKTGSWVLVFRRRPNCYPASMFSPWPSRHLAWVISRMENICCALEYAGIEHGDLTPDSVWVNPLSHEGILFGDWRSVCEKRGVGDLLDLRKTAIRLAEDTGNPRHLYRFLNSPPKSDAYADFQMWDQVIMDGFGGHTFVNMDV